VPLYQFHVPEGVLDARRRAELARTVTEVHAAVTGAPSEYVQVSFSSLSPDSLFVAGHPVEEGRLVGIIRSGRAPETKRRLIEGLTAAWTTVTGQPAEQFGVFVQEVPGSSMMEHGQILPEASED
jgi:phenylpyruvate tautomerase PptA (4-oxalocrotonate tautomerase family)